MYWINLYRSFAFLKNRQIEKKYGIKEKYGDDLNRISTQAYGYIWLILNFLFYILIHHSDYEGHLKKHTHKFTMHRNSAPVCIIFSFNIGLHGTTRWMYTQLSYSVYNSTRIYFWPFSILNFQVQFQFTDLQVEM